MLKRLLAILAAMAWAFAGAAYAAMAPSVDEYGKLPGVERAALSPSGEKYAVAGRMGGERRLMVVGSDGRPLVQISLNEEKVRDVQWAGEDYVLITTSRTLDVRDDRDPDYEVAHVGILNLKSRKMVYAMSSGPVLNGVFGDFGVRQVDGKWFGWFGGITRDQGLPKRGHPDLYRVDLDTGRAEREAVGGEGRRTRRWLLDEDGEVIARSDYFEEGSWRLTVGKKKVMEVPDPLHQSGIIGLGRKPGTVLYTVAGASGSALVELTPGAPGNGQQLFPENDEPSFELIYDPTSSLLIGAVSEGDKPAYSFFEPWRQARADEIAAAFPDYRARLVSWSQDFTRVIVFTDGKDDSGTFWMVDARKPQPVAIGFSYPTIGPGSVAPVQVVNYSAGDGLPIEGVLTLPPGPQRRNLPVVVMPHGGPQSRDYPGFDWMAQAFASRGYAVFQPNYRGSAGYGQGFVDAGRGEFGRKMQTDISDGLAYLVREGIVDGSRACIVGASYGGYAALAGVTLQNGIYRCAVSYSGVSDLVAFARHKSQSGGAEARRFWRDYIGDETTMRELSPARQAGRADAPILLIHGRDDTVVLHAQSLEMERVLRRSGKDVEMVSLDGEDHWLSTSAARTAMLRAAIEFVEKHNPAGTQLEDPMEIAKAPAMNPIVLAAKIGHVQTG